RLNVPTRPKTSVSLLDVIVALKARLKTDDQGGRHHAPAGTSAGGQFTHTDQGAGTPKPAPQAPAPAATNPAHATSDEYVAWFKTRNGYDPKKYPDEELRAFHHRLVATAIQNDAGIPERVLDEYPDLKQREMEIRAKDAHFQEALRQSAGFRATEG